MPACLAPVSTDTQPSSSSSSWTSPAALGGASFPLDIRRKLEPGSPAGRGRHSLLGGGTYAKVRGGARGVRGCLLCSRATLSSSHLTVCCWTHCAVL
jgi:hypothetical protein